MRCVAAMHRNSGSSTLRIFAKISVRHTHKIANRINQNVENAFRYGTDQIASPFETEENIIRCREFLFPTIVERSSIRHVHKCVYANESTSRTPNERRKN